MLSRYAVARRIVKIAVQLQFKLLNCRVQMLMS